MAQNFMAAIPKSFVGPSRIREVGSFTDEFREGFLEGVSRDVLLEG